MERRVLARPDVNLRVTVSRDQLGSIVAVEIDGDELEQR
jgi:hypothetical protein